MAEPETFITGRCTKTFPTRAMKATDVEVRSFALAEGYPKAAHVVCCVIVRLVW